MRARPRPRTSTGRFRCSPRRPRPTWAWPSCSARSAATAPPSSRAARWRRAGGAEGLAALAEIRAHVIVSDLSMPVMDGMEFLRRVRQLPGQAQAPTPAIAFTGFGDRYSETRARAAGFQALLAKPADPVNIA